MGSFKFIIAIILLFSSSSYGQPYSLYSNDSLVLSSEYLRETIRLNLHLPETHPFSASNTKYPITIIFDSQHERTYPHIINSFDLLTSETQIPETIIIGIPFNIQNRFYFTSTQKSGSDSLSGIERMHQFLFSELIPQLQYEYKGNDFISLIGHSRTAFLVNYLAYHRSNEINLAISLSGFFTEHSVSINSFYSFLTDPDNFPNKFYYFYTAGTTLEESSYLSQYRKLDSLLANKTVSENIKITFEESRNANHMSNYWISIPRILINVFSEYNSILDKWFHDKLKSGNIENPVDLFQSDLEKASSKTGVKLNPNLTHIYSLSSYFAYQKEDFETAIKCIEFGLSYFPDYLDFYVELIGFYKALYDNEKIDYYKKILRDKAIVSTHLSEESKKEILEYLDKN